MIHSCEMGDCPKKIRIIPEYTGLKIQKFNFITTSLFLFATEMSGVDTADGLLPQLKFSCIEASVDFLQNLSNTVSICSSETTTIVNLRDISEKFLFLDVGWYYVALPNSLRIAVADALLSEDESVHLCLNASFFGSETQILRTSAVISALKKIRVDKLSICSWASDFDFEVFSGFTLARGQNFMRYEKRESYHGSVPFATYESGLTSVVGSSLSGLKLTKMFGYLSKEGGRFSGNIVGEDYRIAVDIAPLIYDIFKENFPEKLVCPKNRDQSRAFKEGVERFLSRILRVSLLRTEYKVTITNISRPGIFREIHGAFEKTNCVPIGSIPMRLFHDYVSEAWNWLVENMVLEFKHRRESSVSKKARKAIISHFIEFFGGSSQKICSLTGTKRYGLRLNRGDYDTSGEEVLSVQFLLRKWHSVRRLFHQNVSPQRSSNHPYSPYAPTYTPDRTAVLQYSDRSGSQRNRSTGSHHFHSPTGGRLSFASTGGGTSHSRSPLTVVSPPLERVGAPHFHTDANQESRNQMELIQTDGAISDSVLSISSSDNEQLPVPNEESGLHPALRIRGRRSRHSFSAAEIRQIHRVIEDNPGMPVKGIKFWERYIGQFGSRHTAESLRGKAKEILKT